MTIVSYIITLYIYIVFQSLFLWQLYVVHSILVFLNKSFENSNILLQYIFYISS